MAKDEWLQMQTMQKSMLARSASSTKPHIAPTGSYLIIPDNTVFIDVGGEIITITGKEGEFLPNGMLTFHLPQKAGTFITQTGEMYQWTPSNQTLTQLSHDVEPQTIAGVHDDAASIHHSAIQDLLAQLVNQLNMAQQDVIDTVVHELEHDGDRYIGLRSDIAEENQEEIKTQSKAERIKRKGKSIQTAEARQAEERRITKEVNTFLEQIQKIKDKGLFPGLLFIRAIANALNMSIILNNEDGKSIEMAPDLGAERIVGEMRVIHLRFSKQEYQAIISAPPIATTIVATVAEPSMNEAIMWPEPAQHVASEPSQVSDDQFQAFKECCAQDPSASALVSIVQCDEDNNIRYDEAPPPMTARSRMARKVLTLEDQQLATALQRSYDEASAPQERDSDESYTSSADSHEEPATPPAAYPLSDMSWDRSESTRTKKLRISEQNDSTAISERIDQAKMAALLAEGAAAMRRLIERETHEDAKRIKVASTWHVGSEEGVYGEAISRAAANVVRVRESNGDYNDDEALQQAIQASLREESSAQHAGTSRNIQNDTQYDIAIGGSRVILDDALHGLGEMEGAFSMWHTNTPDS